MIEPRRIAVAAVPEYSSVCPWSSDGSRLLLIGGEGLDHFQLHDGDGNFLGNSGIGASERPRWHHRDPVIFTFLRGNRLIIYDIKLGINDSREFLEHISIDDGGEADISEDCDHRVLIGTRADGSRVIFRYQISTGKSDLEVEQDGTINNAIITPDNNLLLDGMDLWLQESDGNYDGNRIFGTDSHKCVTRYHGREVLLTSNSNENPVTLPDFPNGIVRVDLGTPAPHNQTGLLALPWDLAVHISAPQNAEWCLVTTYAPTAPNRQDGHYNAILKVRLDGSGSEILCHHNSSSADYTRQPKASISRDGSRFVYASDDGNPGGPVNTWMGVLGDVYPAIQSLENVQPAIHSISPLEVSAPPNQPVKATLIGSSTFLAGGRKILFQLWDVTDN